MHITIGAIIAPKVIPNLNHNLLSGLKNFEFIKPKHKKINEIIINQKLMEPPAFKGHKPTIKNTVKKTNPKLRFDPIFIFESFAIINYFQSFIILTL